MKNTFVCLVITLYSLSLSAQTKLEYTGGFGVGSAKYLWPHGNIKEDVAPVWTGGFGIRAKSKINDWLYLGTEIGMMRAQSHAYLDMTYTGSSLPQHTAKVSMRYNLLYGYFFFFPEFHPFKWKPFYIRAFPALKLTVADDYVWHRGSTGGMTTSSETSYYNLNLKYDDLTRRRHHPYLFFFDAGVDLPVGEKGLAVITGMRLTYIPRSKYFDSSLEELGYPDNRFFLMAVNLGLSYSL